MWVNVGATGIVLVITCVGFIRLSVDCDTPDWLKGLVALILICGAVAIPVGLIMAIWTN